MGQKVDRVGSRKLVTKSGLGKQRAWIWVWQWRWDAGNRAGGELFPISRILDMLTVEVEGRQIWELGFWLVCLLAQGSLVEGGVREGADLSSLSFLG